MTLNEAPPGSGRKKGWSDEPRVTAGDLSWTDGLGTLDPVRAKALEQAVQFMGIQLHPPDCPEDRIVEVAAHFEKYLREGA